jgi:hypothetical protein
MAKQGNHGPEGNGRAARGPKSKRTTEKYVFQADGSAEVLLQMAIGMALSGGALRIGLTRDGGALAIGVYAGQDYGTEYVRPGEDLEVELLAIADAWGIPLAINDEDAGVWTVS